MSAAVELLPWDSDFFGFPVARLTAEAPTAAQVAAALAECQALGVQLVYWHCQPADEVAQQAARQLGAWLADCKVTFALTLPATLPPADASVVATTASTPQLESLTWQSGEYSRFALDPRLPASAYRQLYSLWLRNSLNGTIARAVLTIPDAHGEALGLLTLGEKNGRADIGLLAVDERARRQRVGQRLVAEAQRRAADAGYTQLQVVTQRANAGACSFYERCGFTIDHEEYIYHLWLA